MRRFPRLLAASSALAALALFFPLGPSPHLAEAATKDARSGGDQGADLMALAPNFSQANEDSIVLLSNTSNSPIRALMSVSDRTQDILGCNMKTLMPGDQIIMYVLTRSSLSIDSVANILSVKVLGLSTGGSILGNLGSRAGLGGQIAQVDQTTGETHSMVPMLETSVPSAERQAIIDACISTGFGTSMAGGSDVVTTTQPAGWVGTKKQTSNSKH